MDYTSDIFSEEDRYWIEFFRNKKKWVYVNDSNDPKFKPYFTYGNSYHIDYVNYYDLEVYLIEDNGRDDIPLSFNDLINNFETIEELRSKKLKEIGIE